MNMERINAALKAYKSSLKEADYLRLEFFKGIWEIQDRHRVLAAASGGYLLPDTEEAEANYWQERPFFSYAPVNVDKDGLVASLKDIAGYLAQNAGLEARVSSCLETLDWQSIVEKTDLSLAGQDPIAYSEAFCGAALKQSDSVLLPETGIIVIAFALRPLIEDAALSVMDSLSSTLKKSNTLHNKPMLCPACGSLASAALVGETPSSQGLGRLLYCSTCATEWEFERVRCARCGSRNQEKLHYYHIEGDDAHRVHLCDECGGYTRTVFQESTRAPFVFAVEDVVMAPLDKVAANPQF